MQEQQRVVRAYSEDTERPYFQIRYRLSLTGKELLADALSGNPMYGMNGMPSRGDRSESVSTTVSMAPGAAGSDVGIFGGFQGFGAENGDPTNRASRSRSLEFTNYMAADGPQTNFRPGQNGIFPESDHQSSYMDVDQMAELRRSRSAGTASEFQLNRGAPAIPVEDLHNPNSHFQDIAQSYPELATEFSGLVTCLNSKNVRKYRVGQPYRKGVIIGIDDEQGKIIVYQRNLPMGTLVVMHSKPHARYEKGYTVQNIQGRVLGTVHAMDRVQNLLVVNTSAAL
ncbi:Hypothetical Protein FCC1311_086372 [Hondaea fermentalgiana]|uniref:Uncharacterized protein n=1 Tax=Hondaea fermentalgiana TaxID=2315210 RepID=A0A2R5GND4_9STRA|nr:Hypothetical Protein FCC1311_086372 [Hondaea fermentalgiana]|eukprot:GBG32412.1 Hypothetical Protein FCC1311_086372 [Hondaea fermentalgiana]